MDLNENKYKSVGAQIILTAYSTDHLRFNRKNSNIHFELNAFRAKFLR